jgi:modulator of FtsH protease HflK
VVWKEPGKDKDPWEDGGQGSPDLEKLVDDLHKRFSAIFGRRRRRGRGRNRVFLWLIPLAVLAWSLSGCYMVDTGDRGVDFLLGRFQSVTTEGLHWHVPWPLGQYQIVSGVDQGTDYLRGYSVLPTADGNAVSVEVSVHYRITDLPQYLFANASPAGGSAAADVIGNLTDGAVSAAVAHAPLSALMGPGVDAVDNAVREQLLAGLKRYPAGIEVRPSPSNSQMPRTHMQPRRCPGRGSWQMAASKPPKTMQPNS